ncbi:LL-diaminopimelate aminotransferase apoenzyme [Oscillospiraceae bacterium]|nr:LL-diaminopimelate aminotransferase apoenzyme [Oscillospiraceae bacterium]
MKIKVNKNFENIKETYLFSEIASRVKKYQQENPDKKIIRMGIGDVTLPLPKIVVDALRGASAEMGVKETFRGYPPEYGYDFLKDAINAHYARIGVDVPSESIFVSDGAKSDLGNIVDILGDNEIIIPDPVYPVYVDSNLMSGRKITLVEGNIDNGFLPLPDQIDHEVEGAVIYLCSPNNPTGAVYSYEGLKAWVDYALKTGSMIIYDSAYEAFVVEDVPHTIYEIEGADQCAIEICSFSKFAGFTGVRCGWTVVPSKLSSDGFDLAKLWKRRQATKFNGVSYPVQRAAEMALSEEGRKACSENISYYKNNASMLARLLEQKKIRFTGGVNSPYIWLQCPNGMGSWEFFDLLLNEAQIVGTPGEGFGKSGEGFFRLTAFGTNEATKEAVERLDKLL